MSARSFGSLFMVASCASAALGCYLVSLRVASERATLEGVETKIVLAQRDLRVLQTEIGTRGRLSQLERWNAGAFSMSAPSANQFVGGGFELAKLTQPEHQVDFQAPVVLASAPAPVHQPQAVGSPVSDDSGQQTAPEPAPSASPRQMLHEASLKTAPREVAAPVAAAPKTAAAAPRAIASAAAAVPASKSKQAAKPTTASSQPSVKAAAVPAKKAVDKLALAPAKPVTKAAHLAKTDPLAPLADKHSGKTKGAPTGR